MLASMINRLFRRERIVGGALACFRYSFLISGLSLLILSQGQGATLNSEPDPSRQSEKDWVDNRWSKSDVGQFLSSNIDAPESRVAKGLSIKVGDHDEGAVCFDTGSCSFRAGWLGGFLSFSGARFGLTVAPKIDGVVAFDSPAGPGWVGNTNHYSGLHLNGKRVVLEYTVGDSSILDSPWFEIREGIQIFTRSMELAPSTRELKLVVATAEGDSVPFASGKRDVLAFRAGTNGLSICVMGTDVSLSSVDGKATVIFPAHAKPLRAKILIGAGTGEALLKFGEIARASGGAEDLHALLQAGPAHWLPELKTKGQRGTDTDILAIDTLTVPYENPWKALMFLAGVDFTADGAAYVCSIHGDVWRVTGIDDRLGELHWKRYATGLFQPLGLKVRDGKVYVLGRDQITCLHDLNGDGEADFYENFFNGIQTLPGHAFVAGLETDLAGNFYYADTRGAHRVSRDGKSRETLATGLRNPNGMGVSPDGQVITVSPQQGEWTPSSVICEIHPGAYYGFGGPKVTAERALGYDIPLCWIPHGVDNSSSSEVWVPAGKWGALGGQMLHLLWGRCRMMLVLRDQLQGVSQGAVVPLPGRFLSGPQRGSFNAKDGNLYIAGSTGWQTAAAREGSLERVRFTGKPVALPVAWHAHSNGLTLAFSDALDRSTAEDAGSYSIHQWNYRYASQYGSKDWSVATPEKEGRDECTVKSARLLPDGKTVFIEIPGLQPVMQMEIQYNVNTAAGKPLRSQFWLTLNRLDAARQ